MLGMLLPSLYIKKSFKNFPFLPIFGSVGTQATFLKEAFLLFNMRRRRPCYQRVLSLLQLGNTCSKYTHIYYSFKCLKDQH